MLCTTRPARGVEVPAWSISAVFVQVEFEGLPSLRKKHQVANSFIVFGRGMSVSSKHLNMSSKISWQRHYEVNGPARGGRS